MNTQTVTPICAFDIVAGQAVPVSSEWLEPFARQQNGYRWIHFDLADSGLRQWASEQLPNIAAQALLQSETRPRCDLHEDGIILNLRGVNLNPDASPEDMVSLRLWATERTIVSARVRKVWVADSLRLKAESGTGPESVGAFLAELASGLTKRIEAVSLELEDETDSLEEVGLSGNEIKPESIARLRQTVIKLRRYISPQRDALDALSSLKSSVIHSDASVLVNETANRTRRTLEELDASRDRLTALQEQMDAEHANALARNGYLLSVVAAIFLPLGFLTGLFGVNIAGMPGLSAPFAFWALTLASVAIGIALYVVFKLSKWL
ncbi:zinc transporter ZntB [Ruegeria sp. HKCCD6604]|uniref:zinc transporter ZntB n=1 Tax=Ruegeria sp. HKCCD6604 TaxID=2683000 RepID=UPI001491AF63|nr:zinc transporter ZntB [Ruegeria sp. HKCCD6604]NOC93833.1 zinc transporter ZntB [Ruegeria sp. HKCCD6604]